MDNKDVLSDIFATLRISSNLYFQADLRGDFSVQLPVERRHIRFHLVREHHCWLTVPGSDVVRLEEGDLAIVPNGASQILSGAPDIIPVALSDILTAGALQRGVLEYGCGPQPTRLLCGFYQFDEAVDHPILSNLPELIIIRSSDLGPNPWALATLRLIILEVDLNGQGMSGILARLLEILFIQFARQTTGNRSENDSGFFAALSDRYLSKALQVMHAEPHNSWKISDLAKISGMSRARFADRFTAAVGMPPIAYLTTWRLLKARRLLAGTGLDMTEIALRCGYASVPSFSSRFKKAFGLGPGAYRRNAQSGVSSEHGGD